MSKQDNPVIGKVDMIHSPWASDVVDALNAFQRKGTFHPFTCPGHEGGGDRTLVATRNGWICCHCDYQQKWAHPFMTTQT